MKKFVFVLKNLTCAGCAAEIERELRTIDGIAGLTLDFLGRELTLFLSNPALEKEIYPLVRKIVGKIEPGVEVVLASHKESEYRFRDSIYASFKTKETLVNLLGTLIFLIALFNLIPGVRIIAYLMSYFIIGRDVVRGALRKLFSRYLFNEHLLMTVATLGALLIGEYAEAVAVMLFYQIGRFFENKILEYSQHSIDEMQKLKPEYANLISNGQIIKVLPEKVNVKDSIVVKPGEKVPLDGVITKGSSSIDNFLLTGESAPVIVSSGDKISAGSINLQSSFTIRVEHEYENSAISRIIDLVRTAKSRKTRTERFITRFASIYTPLVLGLALMISLVPPFVLSIGTFQTWFYRALIFLVISCPCALVISVPLSFFAGLAVLVRNGILVKGGVFLENLARTKVVILDKTGTLTRGKIVVKQINPEPGIDEEELLYNAYLAESHSSHPLALAVSAEYHRKFSGHKEIDLPQLSYDEFAGKGVEASGEGMTIQAGSRDYFSEKKIPFTHYREDDADEKRVIGVARNGKFLGTIEFMESLRSKITGMIDKLKSMNIERIVMLTGDREETAKEVAESLNITEYYANLLPRDKLRYIDKIKEESRGKVLFIGDGINDAPAMALADTGMAMGGIGSPAAVESSDIVLQTDEIENLHSILRLAKKTLNNARQNIILALGIKAGFLVLGSLGLITIWGAVFADVGVTILAVMNSLRLLRYRKNFGGDKK